MEYYNNHFRVASRKMMRIIESIKKLRNDLRPAKITKFEKSGGSFYVI